MSLITMDGISMDRFDAICATVAARGQGEIPIEWNYKTLRVREALPDEEGEWPKGRGRR